MEPSYLVFDTETIPDGEALSNIVHGGLIPPEKAEEIALAQALQKSEGKSDFLQLPFHTPVCVGVMLLSLRGEKAVSMVIKGTPQKIVKQFWTLYDSGNYTLVSYNGRGFDLPLLELISLKYSLTIPSKYFDKYGPRNRFGDGHIDLQEFLNNSGAARVFGGLDTFSKWIGRAGKSDVTGSDVRGLHASGDFEKIYAYCLDDVRNTAALFLRTRVLTGILTPEKENALLMKLG